ncbi:MAG: FG-GAP-like repeat-containing protein [Dongiaceae bacterium]
MPFTLNTNIGTLIANRSLQNTDRVMQKSLERLSSGKNAPQARYDVAGITVSSRIRGQIVSLQQAVQNATQATALLQTAEGAYAQAENILNRMRSLATQAQSQSISTVERGMLNSEYQQLKTELTRMARSTNFAGTALLAAGGISFQAGIAQDTQLSQRPESVVYADLNGDGIQDIVLASSNDSALMVSLGQADGSFNSSGASGYYISISSIYQLVSGDFNGDGKKDIAAIDSNGEVFLYNAESDGRLTSMGSFGANFGGAGSMVAADINGDGRDDLVISSFNSVYYYRNTGSFNFASAQLVSHGLSAESNVMAADMNNDGMLDIIATGDTGSVSVLRNNNNGSSFTNVAAIGGGSSSWPGNITPVQIADINGDGNLDVLVAEYGNPEIYYFLGSGSGALTPGPVHISLDEGIGDFSLADMDGDGILDIIASSAADSKVYYYRGLGTAQFAAAQNSNANGNTGGTFVIFDTDNDGRLDIVAADGATGDFSVLRNTSTMGYDGSARVGSGATPSNTISYHIGSVAPNSLDNQLADSNIASLGAAKRAAESAGRAQDQLLRYRSAIGAVVNRMEKVQSNLATMIEGYELARSSIADVDAAQEMSNFVAQQVLKDMGISMLAQASVTQQNILQLFDISKKPD